MYNLKSEAIGIINILKENNHNAYFVKEYPFIKYNNNQHPNEKLKLKQIEIVTDATKEELKKLFKISKIENFYNKSLLIDVEIKGNLIHFRIFYKENYINVLNGKEVKINSIQDILDNFGFSIETIMMNEEMEYINYKNKKIDSFESIKDKTILPNGNFREKILESPIRIFQLINYLSNTEYSVNNSIFKLILHNNKHMQYESLPLIMYYFNLVLTSKKPSIGLKCIKQYLNNFQYNNILMFEFMSKYNDDYFDVFDTFDNSIDLINRWVYLLHNLSKKEYLKVLDNFPSKNSNKIIWSLEHYNIIENNKDNFKMEIYESKDSLKIINEKYDVFTLFESFNRLMKLKSKLYPENIEIYNKVIDTLCSRPFFVEQLKYTDEYICEIANYKQGDWLKNTKVNLLKKIIMSERHPNDEAYMEMLKESIEYGLISEL